VKPNKLLLAAILMMIPAVGRTQESLPATDSSAGIGLAPGDQIVVHMFDFTELGGPITVHIAADGMVHLPYAGTLQAAGRTPDQLQAAIDEALRNQGMVKEPNVTVDVQTAVNLAVNVIGQVQVPKAVPLYAPAPISYILSQVGGLSGVASPHLTVIHPGDVMPTSLDYDPEKPNPAVLHTLVKPGDIIHVASRGVYFIVGEVNRPGIFPIGGGLTIGTVTSSFGIGVVKQLTLLEALTQAGGITPIAARSKMRILRIVDGKREEILVDEVKLYKGEIADPIIHPDDIIYVPSSYIRQQTNNLFATAVSGIYAATQVRSLQ
jgi:polysaccharide biosynthesis/export protein